MITTARCKGCLFSWKNTYFDEYAIFLDFFFILKEKTLFKFINSTELCYPLFFLDYLLSFLLQSQHTSCTIWTAGPHKCMDILHFYINFEYNLFMLPSISDELHHCNCFRSCTIVRVYAIAKLPLVNIISLDIKRNFIQYSYVYTYKSLYYTTMVSSKWNYADDNCQLFSFQH